jgi:threonine aldolase
MKKITTLVEESEKDMLTEAASGSFEKELESLVAKYSDAMAAELKDKLKTKIANVLKKKAGQI